MSHMSLPHAQGSERSGLTAHLDAVAVALAPVKALVLLIRVECSLLGTCSERRRVLQPQGQLPRQGGRFKEGQSHSSSGESAFQMGHTFDARHEAAAGAADRAARHPV